jgi:hypothetical protein
MKGSDVYPSNYLKAADLQGKEIKVYIERVEMGEIGDDRKPILYFQGKTKGVVLNKTNWNNIAYAYGDESDDWFGKAVILFTAWVDFQGKSVEAIRIRPSLEPKKKAAPRRQTPHQESENPADGLEDIGGVIGDEIPF